jgi:DNA-binding transcriptional LysR family regulator
MIALKVSPAFSMAVVATPDYLAQSGPIDHPSDLTRHRCINYRMVAAGTIYAWEFEHAGQLLNVQVSGPLTFNEPELMLEATLDGLGVGYLLDYEVAPYVGEGRLVRLLAAWTPPFPGFYLYYSSRQQMRPILTALLDLIRARR